MSAYATMTSTEREVRAAQRRPGEEVPKCARFFDHDADCDLFRSHACGPDDNMKAYSRFFAENMWEMMAQRKGT